MNKENILDTHRKNSVLLYGPDYKLSRSVMKGTHMHEDGARALLGSDGSGSFSVHLFNM